ncbi:hypothetical protein BaRGS_00028381, partial [Batillaria attramentaria]
RVKYGKKKLFKIFSQIPARSVEHQQPGEQKLRENRGLNYGAWENLFPVNYLHENIVLRTCSLSASTQTGLGGERWSCADLCLPPRSLKCYRTVGGQNGHLAGAGNRSDSGNLPGDADVRFLPKGLWSEPCGLASRVPDGHSFDAHNSSCLHTDGRIVHKVPAANFQSQEAPIL